MVILLLWGRLVSGEELLESAATERPDTRGLGGSGSGQVGMERKPESAQNRLGERRSWLFRSLGHVHFVILRTVVTVPLSKGFPRARILEWAAILPPRIFLAQGSNPCFLHCRRFLYC